MFRTKKGDNLICLLFLCETLKNYFENLKAPFTPSARTI